MAFAMTLILQCRRAGDRESRELGLGSHGISHRLDHRHSGCGAGLVLARSRASRPGICVARSSQRRRNLRARQSYGRRIDRRCKTASRDVTIDVARGIAIVLVVLGHNPALASAAPGFVDALFLFHVPLFFLLSGLVQRAHP